MFKVKIEKRNDASYYKKPWCYLVEFNSLNDSEKDGGDPGVE